jgi:hypothetical protein
VVLAVAVSERRGGGGRAVAVGVAVRCCRKNSESLTSAWRRRRVASKVFMRLDEGSESVFTLVEGVWRKVLAAEARLVRECMGELKPRVEESLLHMTSDSAASVALNSSSVFMKGISVLTLSCAMPRFL